jgi:hypothetical protein
MATNTQGLPVFIGLSTPGPLPNYISLISSSYRGSTNFLLWLAGNLQLYQDGIACLNQFDQAFYLLTAVGPQLDILGAIVGQNRTVSFQPRFGISPTLDDTTYRLLLRAVIQRNHWDGRTVSLWTGWNSLFPSSRLLISDHQDMSVGIAVGLTASTIVQDLILNGYVIPRPQGVLYQITIQAGGWNASGEWNTFEYGSVNPGS